MNVLLIEDDIEIREMICRMLTGQNYTISMASNGFEAEKLLQSKVKYNLVITDIIMPEKDGIEVIQNLKKNFPDIRILAISGGGKINSTDYLYTAKALGAHNTLPKPFLQQELINAINNTFTPSVICS